MAGQKILVVESDPERAGQIAATLQSLGYVVPALVSCGEEVLEQVDRLQPDLLLISPCLAGTIDGIDVATQVSDRYSLPVILSAAGSSGNTLRRGLVSEPAGVVFRPWDAAEVGTVIDLAFRHHDKAGRLRETAHWFSAVFGSTGDAIIIADAQDRIRAMNPVAEALTGWTQEEGLAKPLSHVLYVLSEETGHPIENLAASAFSQGSAGQGQVNRVLVTREGARKGITYGATPILDDHGRAVGIASVFRYVSAPVEMSKLVKSIVQWATELLGAHAGEIFLYDEARDELRVVISIGYMEEFSGAVMGSGEGIAGQVFQSGQPLIVDDYATWPGRSKVFESTPPFTTILAIPLKWQDRCIGALEIDADAHQRTFTEGDVRLASLFGSLAAIAIANVRLNDELQARMEEQKLVLEQQVAQRTTQLAHLARRLETGAHVSREITSILKIADLLDRVVRLIRQSFGYYCVQVYLTDNESGQLVLQAANGEQDEAAHGQIRRLGIGPGSLNGLAAMAQKVVLVNDVSQEPAFLYDETRPHTRAELVVPLRLGERVLGTLDMQSVHQNAFAQEDIVAFQSLGDQIAIAIENARLYERSRGVAVLEERNRLARELHDSITQSLFSLDLLARAISTNLIRDPQQAGLQVEQLRQITHDALEEMRSLIFDLRPPSVADIGLAQAVRQQIQRLNRPNGMEVELRVTGDRRLPSDLEAGLFRIAQEALYNAVKHSGARHITVELTMEPERVALAVSDDGRGFDSKQPGKRRAFGLIGMAERAELIGAELILTTEPGAGTKIEVKVSNSVEEKDGTD